MKNIIYFLYGILIVNSLILRNIINLIYMISNQQNKTNQMFVIYGKKKFN